jgi:hypothetical protein
MSHVKYLLYISSIKLENMKAILKNEYLVVVLATLAILAIGCVVFPLLVTLFCKGLMFIFTKPMTALAVSGAFLLGMFVNEKLS